MNRLLTVTAALSAALFLTLFVMSTGWLQAGGAQIFDGHLTGYSAAAARRYLAALTDPQTALYLGAFRQIDTVFPLLLTATLAGVIWTQAKLSHPIVRILAAITPCVYLAMDLSENAIVAQMLRTGPLVSDGVILQASATTVAKWISLALSALLAIWAWRLTPRAG